MATMHHGVGLDAGLAALDVHELLGPQVGAEAGLGDRILREPHRQLRGQHAVAAVGDVGEGPAVDEGRIAFQRLHEVRLEGVFQEHGHGAVGLQIGRGDRFAVAGIGDDDPPQPLAQFGQRLAEAEAGHDLGGDGDVEAAFAGHRIVHPAQADDDVPQRPVVHVHDPLPDDPPQVDSQGVAVVDVVVEHGGKEVVGQLDGVEVAGEMEVDVLHGDDLGISAADSPPFMPKHVAECSEMLQKPNWPRHAVSRES